MSSRKVEAASSYASSRRASKSPERSAAASSAASSSAVSSVVEQNTGNQSPHVQGNLGLDEDALGYVRSIPGHVVLYFTREIEGGGSERTEFFADVSVLGSKYATFQTLFDPELAKYADQSETGAYYEKSLREWTRIHENVMKLLTKMGVVFDTDGNYVSGPSDNNSKREELMKMYFVPKPARPGHFVNLDMLIPDTIITDMKNKCAKVWLDENGNPKEVEVEDYDPETQTSTTRLAGRKVLARAPLSAKVILLVIDLAYWSTLYSRQRESIRNELPVPVVDAYLDLFGGDKVGYVVPDFKIPAEIVYECLEVANVLGDAELKAAVREALAASASEK